MNPEVMQSLVASGMQADAAARIAKAIDSAYKLGPANSKFSASTSEAVSPNASGADRYALYASGPASVLGDGPSFGKGKAALGVDGLAVVDGEVYATQTVHAENVVVRGDIDLAGSLSARDAAFARGLVVDKAGEISRGFARFFAPLISSNNFLASRAALFSGPATFLAPLSIRGQVDWDGPRKPATVRVVSLVNTNGGDTLSLVRKEVSVLNDWGDVAPAGKLKFTLDGGTTATLLTGVTLSSTVSTVSPVTSVTASATTASVTFVSAVATAPADVVVSVPTQATFTATTSDLTYIGSVQTSSVFVITGVTFDAEACAVTYSGNTVSVVVSVGTSSTPVVTGGTVSIPQASTASVNQVISVSQGSATVATACAVTASTTAFSAISTASISRSTTSVVVSSGTGIKITAL